MFIYEKKLQYPVKITNSTAGPTGSGGRPSGI